MKLQNAHRWLLCLSLISPAAFSQSLVISTDSTSTSDDCELILAEDSSVEVDGETIRTELAGGDPNDCLNSGEGGAGATLTAAPSGEVDSGTNVTFSWSIPDAPYSCNFSRNGVVLLNNTDIRDENGSKAYTVNASATYKVSCRQTKPDGFNLTESTVDLTVAGIINPDETACSQQITGWNRANPRFKVNNSGNFTAEDYEDLFAAWGTSSSTIKVSMEPDNYASLRFEIPANSDRSENLNFGLITNSYDEVRISVTEGCYGPPLASNAVARCFGQFSASSEAFKMNEGGVTGCSLQQGKVYYFNFMFADSLNNNSCTSIGGCEWQVIAN